jgi:hypothetical protein
MKIDRTKLIRRIAALAALCLFASHLPSYGELELRPEGSKLGLFIYGISGAGKYKKINDRSWDKLSSLLLVNGYRTDEIWRFSESPALEPKWGGDEVNDQRNIGDFLREISERKTPYEEVFIYISGHANGRDEKAKFHTSGEDVSYEKLMRWIDKIPAKNIVIVLALSQGHVWISELSRPGRIIIAGTGMRKFDMMPLVFSSIFPSIFEASAQAFDREVSLKEAFIKTQYFVRKWYQVRDLYITETALLDDEGKGQGKDYLDKVKEIENEVLHRKTGGEFKENELTCLFEAEEHLKGITREELELIDSMPKDEKVTVSERKVMSTQ